MQHINLVIYATCNNSYIECIAQELFVYNLQKQNGENDNENITCIAMHRAAIATKNKNTLFSLTFEVEGNKVVLFL